MNATTHFAITFRPSGSTSETEIVTDLKALTARTVEAADKFGHSVYGNALEQAKRYAPVYFRPWNDGLIGYVEILKVGRVARCTYFGKMKNRECNYGGPRGEVCACELPSSPNLPFFEHQPDQEKDRFFCGCAGWD